MKNFSDMDQDELQEAFVSEISDIIAQEVIVKAYLEANDESYVIIRTAVKNAHEVLLYLED